MKKTLIGLFAVVFAATAMPVFAADAKSDEKKPAAEAKDKKGGEKAPEKDKAAKKERKQREGC